MLKSWLIQNFKPILDSGELKLAPVTVLAGRNSSGKSSLIQSILMIEQTLSSRIVDRALLPNGPIVQLGTFEDILSEQTDLRTLVVGFELEGENDRPREFSIDIKPVSATELDDFLKGVSPEYLRLVPYTTKESNYLGTFKLKSKLTDARMPDPSLIAFSHFLPARLIRKYIIEERRKLRLILAIDRAISH